MLILIIIALIIKIEMLLEFQNEMNIEIIRFLLIHLRFVLDLTAIDLQDIDLLHTDIASKHFACL